VNEPAMHAEGQVEALLRYARDLPEGTVLPVSREVVLALASERPTVPAAERIPAPDQSVEELAARFGRKGSTVREWCEQGLFPGAYKLRDREWRVPLAGIAAFEQKERERGRRDRGTGRAFRLVRDSKRRKE
jgi:hypothetical protein